MITLPNHSTTMEGEMGCVLQDFFRGETIRKVAEKLQVLAEYIAGSELETNMGRVEVKNEEFSGENWRKKRAAVLICLFEGREGELRVILTKRSMKLSSHPGDVALPGGRTDEGDADDSATALREAHEEIGLDPGLVQVVAKLEPFISQQQLKVVPVVGILTKMEDFNPILNPDEVDAIFDVPLEMFLKDENHRCEGKEWMDWKYSLHLFEYKSEQEGVFIICGLTASILIRAASVIFQRSPCFFHQLPDLPDFQQLQKDLGNMACNKFM